MHTIPPSDFSASEPDELPGQRTPIDLLARSALESTREAIARWTGGIHAPRLLAVGSLHVSAQARWYAQARDGFQEWRDRGGFAQSDETAAPASITTESIITRKADTCVD